MTKFEHLLQEAHDENILVKEVYLKSNSDGLYKNNKIALNKSRLDTSVEKTCVLAEELGHHYTTVGNILDLNDMNNAKQEYKARIHAYNNLVGINGLINAFKSGHRSMHDIAEYLDVTELFLEEVLNHYKSKYGIYTEMDNYTIVFIPNFTIVKSV